MPPGFERCCYCNGLGRTAAEAECIECEGHGSLSTGPVTERMGPWTCLAGEAPSMAWGSGSGEDDDAPTARFAVAPDGVVTVLEGLGGGVVLP